MTPDFWTSPQASLAGLWLAASLTLMAFTYLIGDNPLYRMVEHLLVGVGAAYALIMAVHGVLLPQLIRPLAQAEGRGYALLPALLLGLLLLFRGSGRSGSWSMLAVAFLVGATAGLGLSGALKGTLVPQALTLAGLAVTGLGAEGGGLVSPVASEVAGGVGAAAVGVAGSLATLLYFHMAEGGPWPLPPRVWRAVRGAGYLLLMGALGAVFAATAGSRFALLIARLDFLLGDWLHLL